MRTKDQIESHNKLGDSSITNSEIIMKHNVYDLLNYALSFHYNNDANNTSAVSFSVQKISDDPTLRIPTKQVSHGIIL